MEAIEEASYNIPIAHSSRLKRIFEKLRVYLRQYRGLSVHS